MNDEFTNHWMQQLCDHLDVLNSSVVANSERLDDFASGKSKVHVVTESAPISASAWDAWGQHMANRFGAVAGEKLQAGDFVVKADGKAEPTTAELTAEVLDALAKFGLVPAATAASGPNPRTGPVTDAELESVLCACIDGSVDLAMFNPWAKERVTRALNSLLRSRGLL